MAVEVVAVAIVDGSSNGNGNGSSNGISTKRIEDWHDKEYGIVWKMDNELKRTALALRIN